MSSCLAKNILVVKNRGLGDAVMGLGSIQYLRQIFPDSKITYAVPSWTASLFASLEANNFKIHSLSISGFLDGMRFFNFLREQNFDLVFELHQSGKTGKILSMAKHLLKVNYYFHNHHEQNSYIKDQGSGKASIQRDLDGIWSALSKFHQFELECPSYLRYCPSFNLPRGERKAYAIFGVVATRKPKMWPLEYFKEIAERIFQSDPNFKIYIPLAKSDGGLKKQLLDLSFPQNTEILEMPLEQIPEFFSQGRFYLGNDTGLKHIAVASGMKTYTLFGPENPKEWHPYDKVFHPYFFEEGVNEGVSLDEIQQLRNCESVVSLENIKPEIVFNNLGQELI